MKKSILLLSLFAFIPALGLASRSPRSSAKRPALVRPQRPERPAKVNVADTVEHLSRLREPERQRALAGLPTPQQKQIEEGLGRLERLSTADREQLLERLRRFETLNPNAREKFRKGVKQMEKLPPQRREAIIEELNVLKKLPPADRTLRLNGRDYKSRFNSDERHIIGNTSAVLPDKL